jgi:hypothetical protein
MVVELGGFQRSAILFVGVPVVLAVGGGACVFSVA